MKTLMRLLRKVSATSLLVRYLDKELAALDEENARLARELAAEVAENGRLLEELVAARRLLAKATTAAQPCLCENLPGAVEFWKRQAEQDRRNALVLEDRLARAERRPVIGSLA